MGEREYLITDQLNYQSSLLVSKQNRYGAVNIIRPPPKHEDDGFVQANLFSVNYPSTQSSMTTNSSRTETTDNTEATTGATTSTLNLKKSDSSNSDWISDPHPNDFIEVNVRGREQTQIKYKYDGDKKA